MSNVLALQRLPVDLPSSEAIADVSDTDTAFVPTGCSFFGVADPRVTRTSGTVMCTSDLITVGG